MNAKTAIILLALSLLAFSPLSYSNCEELANELSRQSLKLSELEHKRQALDDLLQGQIPRQFALSTAVEVALDMGLEVARARLLLEREMAQTQAGQDATELRPPAQFEDCPPEQTQWLGQEKQIRSQQEVINTHLLQLYKLPRSSRLALVRETTQWQTLFKLEGAVSNWAREQEQQTDALALRDAIHQWINDWRSSTRIWLGQLIAGQPQNARSNAIWSETLRVPQPANVPVGAKASAIPPPSCPIRTLSDADR